MIKPIMASPKPKTPTMSKKNRLPTIRAASEPQMVTDRFVGITVPPTNTLQISGTIEDLGITRWGEGRLTPEMTFQFRRRVKEISRPLSLFPGPAILFSVLGVEARLKTSTLLCSQCSLVLCFLAVDLDKCTEHC